MTLKKIFVSSLSVLAICSFLTGCNTTGQTSTVMQNKDGLKEVAYEGTVLSARTCSCMRESRFRVQLKSGIAEIIQLNSNHIKKGDKVFLIRDTQGERIEKIRR